ncbi:MAG: hypothetical protein RDV48_31450 [Candidatus Eremiobacteraeota bacterium]|nr:hypothetical protein [Candidatus Eremiobacteraeota bacterium]
MEKLRKRFYPLLLIVSLAIFLAFLVPRGIVYIKQGQTDDIMETVFQYQFDHNFSGKQQNAKAYFLSALEGKDPGENVIRHFSDHRPPVKKKSQCEVKQVGLGEPVIDKETGEEGLLFQVDSIKWISWGRAEVKGGYYESSLSASGNKYSVLRKGRKWIVTEDICEWQQ